MRHLRKRALTGIVVASAALAVAGTASANSITLSFVGTGANTVTASVSDTLGILVFANFSNAQGEGAVYASATVGLGSNLTQTLCAKQPSQVIGSGATNATWARISAACDSNPSLEQGLSNQTTAPISHPGSTTGTVLLGAITFHVGGSGVINTFFTPALDGFGFVSGTFVDTGIPQDSLSVNVIPEPATVALLATGMLGLLGFSRRWKA